MGVCQEVYRFLVFSISYLISDGFSAFPVRPRVTSRYSLTDGAVAHPENYYVDNNSSVPHLVFPGGGLFFYWQAGAITYLREQGYDMTQMTFSGASAGALTATLVATQVDFIEATDLALDMSKEAGVWDRSGGLQGIWGPIIFEWLDRLLPVDAVEMLPHGKLSLLVTKIPSLEKTKVSSFYDRDDLIRCNMASVHLPWFLDGKWTADFRRSPHIDGSFLAKAPDYLPEHRRPSSLVRLDWSNDPAMRNGQFLDFVKVVSPEGIWKILETGKAYAEQMDECGRFARLPKVSDP